MRGGNVVLALAKRSCPAMAIVSWTAVVTASHAAGSSDLQCLASRTANKDAWAADADVDGNGVAAVPFVAEGPAALWPQAARATACAAITRASRFMLLLNGALIC